MRPPAAARAGRRPQPEPATQLVMPDLSPDDQRLGLVCTVKYGALHFRGQPATPSTGRAEWMAGPTSPQTVMTIPRAIGDPPEPTRSPPLGTASGDQSRSAGASTWRTGLGMKARAGPVPDRARPRPGDRDLAGVGQYIVDDMSLKTCRQRPRIFVTLAVSYLFATNASLMSRHNTPASCCLTRSALARVRN